MKHRCYRIAESRLIKLLKSIKSYPGVFLETVYCDKDNFRSFVFTRPKEILQYNLGEDHDKFFGEVEERINSGLWLAGFFSYEFGYIFEPRLYSLLKKKKIRYPLAWLGVFRKPLEVDHRLRIEGEDKPGILQDTGKHVFKGERFNMGFRRYNTAVSSIKGHLKKGNSYQVNLTLKHRSKFTGDASNLYLSLRRAQPTSYSGFINDGSRYILSFSPELFFRRNDNIMYMRPMKGTYKRGRSPEEDSIYKSFLNNDAKNRAENVMIVDLLRNDLGKISVPGSVKVTRLFDIESYPSLFQMTSTVKASLEEGVLYRDIFRALFPSGSVTGAPKIRTMQIIENVEKEARGVYTGAIGFISPKKQACFNVAIRTVVLEKNNLKFGVGSGIVYDSHPEKEYQECKLKTEFLKRKAEKFFLIETIGWEKNKFKFLTLHMKRLKNSCSYFKIPLDTTALEKELYLLSENKFDKKSSYKVKVLVSPEGRISLNYRKIKNSYRRVKIKLSKNRVDSENIFLFHKTTNRKLYDTELKKAKKQGFFDVIFLNEKNQLTEGARTNLFLSVGGNLYTPSLESGLLPGVLREYLLAKKKVRQKDLYINDLYQTDEIFIGNSVRGLLPVRMGGDYKK